MDLTGISLTEADGLVYLRHQPADGRVAVDVAMLHALLEQAGFGQCLLDEAAIVGAAADCNTQQTPFVAQVAKREDAQVQVHVAADDMAAEVEFFPARGGKPITLENIQQALLDAGVVFGIDEAALVQACRAGAVEPVHAATGAVPEHGRDTAFEPLLTLTADRAPKVDANGLIDYREHGSILVVQPGDALMRRVPPTQGLPGHTVRGRELPPRAGVDLTFAPQLAGATLASDDPNLLQAAMVGQPVLVGQGVMVEPVLRVQNVDIANGNIHFDGTVQVDGEVSHGMKVQATGDIVVAGTVEGGLLQAGGDIRVGGGIIARSQVQAQGGVSARFAENSSIRAGTVLALDDMALGCELESFNQIIIGDKIPQRGRLVDGSATAMMLLRVPLLGSSTSGVVRVKVGVNAELDAQMHALVLRLEKEKGAEENLQKLIKHLSTHGDPKGMLERVNASWQQALRVMANSLAERQALEEQMAHMRTARLEVGLGIAGAVDLVFGSRTAHLRTEMGAGLLSLNSEAVLVFTDKVGRGMVIPSS